MSKAAPDFTPALRRGGFSLVITTTARAFEEGVTHVIYCDAEFQHLAVREINAAQAARRALQNLYELPCAKGGEAERDVEAA